MHFWGSHFCTYLTKASVIVALVMLHASPALANPEGGVVSAGSATISSNGKKVDIHQSSNRAVIDWRSFDIAPDEHTQFYQPSSSSTTLNRINSGNPTQILGKLTANGNVLILNGSGVLFGAGSQVDVGGLVATTSGISNDKFMQGGAMRFDQAGNPDAAIINNGTITAKDAGLVGLVAPHVANNGVIAAKLGKVQMASADAFTMDLYGDGLYAFKVSDNVQKQLVSNKGKIDAAGGTIALTAAAGRNVVDSLIEVSGELKAPAVAKKNGKIFIFAEGSNAVTDNIVTNKDTKTGNSRVIVDATLDVSGKGTKEKGGTAEILGDTVALLNGTRIDASGTKGGGTVRVGGDYYGGGNTPTARNTFIEKDVKIKADAVTKGDGGYVTIWADNSTTFYGDVSVKGGDKGGSGGFVEVSGKKYLTFRGNVDTTASKGNVGTLLLDPDDLVIMNGSGDGAADGVATFSGTGGTGQLAGADALSILYESELEGLSASTNIALVANNSITINDLADNLLSFKQNATRTVSMTAGAGGITMLDTNDVLSVAAGGGLSLTTTGAATLGGFITSAGGLSISVGTTSTVNGPISGTGLLTKFGSGNLTLLGTNTHSGGTYSSAGTLIGGTTDAFGTGQIRFNVGNITLAPGSYANALSINSTGTLTSTGDLTFTGHVGGTSNNVILTVNNTGLTTFDGTYFSIITSGSVGRQITLSGNSDIAMNSIVRNGSTANTGTLVFNSSGRLTLNGNNTFAQLNATSGNIVGTTQTALGSILSLGTGTVTSDVANVSFNTILTTGNGILTGDAAYSATTLTNTGNYTLTYNGTGGLTVSGFVSLSNSASARTLTISGSGDATFEGVVRNSNNGNPNSLLSKSGSGTLSLLGANTYSGTTSMSGGTLLLGSDTAVGTGLLSINTGTFRTDGQDVTLANNVSFYTFNVTGDSDLTFTGTLTHTRTTTDSITVNSTGKTTFGNINLINSGTTASTVNFAGSGDIDIAGVIANGGTATSGNVGKNGTGTLTYLGNNTYAGTTTINNGTLAYGTGNAIATGAIVLNGGTLDIGSYSDSVGNVTMNSGNILGSGTLTSTGNFALHSGTVSANLAGNGTLTKNTAGSLTLSGNNTYTGITNINAGTLIIGGDNIFANSSIVQFSDITVESDDDARSISKNINFIGTTLTFDGDHDLAFTGAMTNSNAGARLVYTMNGDGTTSFNNISISTLGAGRTLAFEGAGDAIVTGDISNGNGANSLEINGAGTVTLAGQSTYTGTTAIKNGTLAYGANNAIAASNITINGGTLNIGSYSDTVGTVTLTSGAITGTTGVLTGTSYTADAGTISANLAGAIGLTKNTAGTLTLSGSNTYTGTTTINAGKVILSGGSAIANTATVDVKAGAELELTSNEQIGDLLGTGNVLLTGAGLTFGTANNLTFGGIFSGTGGIEKIGSGSLTLSGANTYSGATKISAGTLRFGDDNVLSSDTSVLLAAGAYLDFNSYSATLGDIYADGTVFFGDDGTITTTGSQIYKGDITSYNTTFVSLNGGDIELLNANNDFMGTVRAHTTGDVSLYDSDELTLGSISANKLFARSFNTLTLTDQIITSSGDDDAILLATSRDFQNLSGFAEDTLNTGAGGRWLVYSATPADDERGGLVYDFKQYNAIYGDTVLGTGNGFMYELAPTLSVSLTGTVTKTYDGTTIATLDDSNYDFTGLVDDDIVFMDLDVTGTYSDANAGNTKNVTINGIAIDRAEDSTGAAVYGYQLSSSGPLNANIGGIDKAALTISTSDVVRGYDGTVVAAGTAVVTSGTLYTNASNGGIADSLSGGTFEFTDANAGTGNKTVTVSGVTIDDGNGGDNYDITFADNTTSTISKAALSIQANGASKDVKDTLNFLGSEFTVLGTLYNTDSVSSVTLNSAGAPANSPVAGSPYAIVASNAVGSGLSNYDITYLDGQLVVTGSAAPGGVDALPPTVVWTPQHPMQDASVQNAPEATDDTENSNDIERVGTLKKLAQKRLDGLLRIHPMIVALFKI